MKTLYLIRHAKSSWALDLTDFERPLNNRGLRNAPEMAARLLKIGVQVDAIFSSSANRALTTARIFAKVLGFFGEIVQKQILYAAKVSVYFDLITGLEKGCDSVMIFAHNPEITDFVNRLGLVNLDNMPTCSVFALQIDTDDWSDFVSAPKTFVFFDYPKSID